MNSIIKKVVLPTLLFVSLLGMAGCKDKQEIAQEQSKEVIKKMMGEPKPAHLRSYDELLKEELARTGKTTEKKDKK